MERINLISGPRNISTALMYSFANRKDTKVIDEPLYASYLTKHPQIFHPGRKEILATQSNKFEIVIDELLQINSSASYFFIKNMAHHLDGQELSFLTQCKNFFLIRDPKQLIISFAKVIPNPSLLDIGLELEWQIFKYLQVSGQSPVVLDSNAVLENPKKVLLELCNRLEIPFDDEMLSWKAGPIKEDGCWAKYWYSNVHKSTGFHSQTTKNEELPTHLEELYEKAKVFYDQLKEWSIQA